MFSLLIAEDEVIEQKALKLLVEKNFHDIEVVAIAGNGIELVTMVQEYDPDMAIVDITMPGISGLEAIEMLRQKLVKTRFIINTAYDKFEFAKKAIGLQVDDYILKPQRQEQTVGTLRRLCDALREEKANRENQRQAYEIIKQIEPVLENEIMFSIFLDAPAEDSFRQYCKLRALRFDMGTVVSMLSLLSTELKYSQMDISHIRENLGRSLNGRCNYLASVNSSTLYLLIFHENTSLLKNWKTWLSDLLSIAMENLQKELGITLKAGAGGSYRQFSDMSKAYQESLIALKSGTQGGIFFYPGDSQPLSGPVNENGVENGIPEGITDNTYVSYAMKYIGIMYGEQLSLEMVADEIGISTYYLSRLFKQELKLTFVEYLTNVRMKSAFALAKNTKMSVNEIAAKIGYNNTTYFTRVFKKYTGMTMSEFRIDARRKL